MCVVARIHSRVNKTKHQLVRKITMDSTRLDAAPAGQHRLPIRLIIRERGVVVKKLPEFITDEPMIKPVVKATDLCALFGDNHPPSKRLKRWKKQNYKIDQRDIPRHEETLEHRVVEVPGENLIVKVPFGVVCYRIEHQGFEYLLHLDSGSLKFFEKRFL